MKRALMLLCVCALALSQAFADMPVKDYKIARAQGLGPAVRAYIYGIGNGYSWANAKLKADKQHPLYCEPGKMALNAENYVGLVDDALKNPDFAGLAKDADPVELLLLAQLILAFPCK